MEKGCSHKKWESCLTLGLAFLYEIFIKVHGEKKLKFTCKKCAEKNLKT